MKAETPASASSHAKVRGLKPLSSGAEGPPGEDAPEDGAPDDSPPTDDDPSEDDAEPGESPESEQETLASRSEQQEALGAGPIRTLRRISVPLVRPGITAGAALVFLTCMKELPATLLLAPTGYSTLATQVYNATVEAFFARAAAPALAVGYAIGRLGCFLVGDDYGRPTDLPWGIAFPDGAPPSTAENLRRMFGVEIPPGVSGDTVLAVHPTQLYEIAMSLIIFAIIWRLRDRMHVPGALFSVYIALAGVERFIVEFFRAKDDRFFGILTVAQLISLALVAAGVAGALHLMGRGGAGGEPPAGRSTRPARSLSSTYRRGVP